MSWKWRLYERGEERDDTPAIVELHLQQEEAIGQRMDLPDLMEKPVMISVVGETRGEVEGAFYVEAVGEICFIGRSPKATAEAMHAAPKVFEFLKKRGIRVVRLLVPKRMPEAERLRIQEALEDTGFTSTDDEYDHYFYDLR